VAGWQELDDRTVRGLLTTMRDLDWGWTPGETGEVLRRLGAEVVLDRPDKGAFGRTTVDIGRTNVSALYKNNRVTRVSVGVVDKGTLRPSRETVIATIQAFDRVVAIGREVLGEPELGARGDERFAHWRGERATIMAGHGSFSLFVDWTPPESADG
jgi:hypothetical protein